MPVKVAVEGEVMATPGSAPYPPAASGTWSPGAVSYQSFAELAVRGVGGIHQASCTFTFTGTASNGTAVTGSETVTLTAAGTRLTSHGTAVLVDGDAAQGSFGNQLKVSARGPLATD